MCIGDSSRPFRLETKALSIIAEKLGMQPNDVEWCFANMEKEHVVDYARDLARSIDSSDSDTSSVNSLSTTESSDEPLTDHDGQSTHDAYVVHAGESPDQVSNGQCK